ncbi:integrase, catalytic region, zinc finger, CCHC-type containing protein, partial [Tanacetum coccineum]
INADLEKFHLCLKEEMVADLRYFNYLEHEVDSLKSQLETQQTQFLNEIDRLSRTRKPIVVPISTTEPKRNVNQSVATSHKKTVAIESTVKKPRSIIRKLYEQLVEIILFIVDSGCSKHMTGNLTLLSNFVEKFLGTVKFGNDQIALILGYGDLLLFQEVPVWASIDEVDGVVGTRNYCDLRMPGHPGREEWGGRGIPVECHPGGRGGRKQYGLSWEKREISWPACYILDLKRNDLLTGSRGTDLYSITLQETSTPNPICLMAKATSHKHGTEFLNKSLHAYFAQEGIEHQTSTARTPEQNNVVERRNRTLVEVARTMLSAAKVPLFFWAEAIATSCFTQNRSLVIPRHEKTPYHIINGRKPSVKFFHIFGSLCYIVRDGENLEKMKEKR